MLLSSPNTIFRFPVLAGYGRCQPLGSHGFSSSIGYPRRARSKREVLTCHCHCVSSLFDLATKLVSNLMRALPRCFVMARRSSRCRGMALSLRAKCVVPLNHAVLSCCLRRCKEVDRNLYLRFGRGKIGIETDSQRS
jgi:hypothetical protein